MNQSKNGTGALVSKSGYSFPYSSRYSRPTKESWCGNNIGNAFKSHLSHYVRTAAAGLFYMLTSKVQKAAAKLSGQSLAKEFKPKAKPQLTPVYSTYPPGLAALAAIGWTGFLEFKAWSGTSALTKRLGPNLGSLLQRQYPNLEPEPLQKMVAIVANTVQSRLLFEDLHKQEDMSAVENYRLFMASSQSMNFPSVPSILSYVVLYDDVLPDWKSREFHPQTCSLLKGLEKTSKPYFCELAQAPPSNYMPLGERWVKDLMACLVQYLPEKSVPEPKQPPGKGPTPDAPGRYSKDNERADDRIAPSGGKQPPSLFDPPPSGAGIRGKNILQDLRGHLNLDVANALLRKRMQKIQGEEPAPTRLEARELQTLTKFHEAITGAGRQDRTWEDTRSDIAEELCKAYAFSEGPITGQAVEGHEVEMSYAGEYYGGQLFDRPIDLKFEAASKDALVAESDVLYRRLRKLVFPNREPVSTPECIVTTGGLDPARIPIAECSDAVFKRYRTQELEDQRGRPVVLLVNDASGSVGTAQMKLMKLLSMAWIRTSLKNKVQILAGMYNLGQAQTGVSGPLVEWLYHPEKTPALTPKDTLRSIAAMPEKGNGGQADAISLQFMLNEAIRIARHRSIYLTLIGDFNWCRSFPGMKPCREKDLEGAELEMRTFFENAYEKLGEKLHVTLVGLNAREPQRYKKLVDKVIAITDKELNDSAAVAEKIGTYVATCMRERKNANAR